MSRAVEYDLRGKISSIIVPREIAFWIFLIFEIHLVVLQLTVVVVVVTSPLVLPTCRRYFSSKFHQQQKIILKY